MAEPDSEPNAGKEAATSHDIDAMTPEQLRDTLAEARGWQRSGQDWVHPEKGLQCAGVNPIPPLDSHEALGVVAGMMPREWKTLISWTGIPTRSFCCWVVCAHRQDAKALDCSQINASGPTETIARARLVLKVLAAATTTAPTTT